MEKFLYTRIRFKLKSFDSKTLKLACQNILHDKNLTKYDKVGPVPLPTKKRIYCVLRSPYMNEDAREHFEIKTYSHLIDLFLTKEDTKHCLVQITLPAGVSVQIKKTKIFT